jgi:hypothetical protein
MKSGSERIGASFRDPSGFIFKRDGVLYRQVNQSYSDAYDRLISSGVYAALTRSGMLIAHTESTVKPADPLLAYKVIQPEPVPFISYPYEWSFSQLKDAALLTLSVTRAALEKGMILKDASAYNIQFINGKPVLIDTLSFDIYKEGAPWDAYRQFCQHFLAPLALASMVDIRLTQLLRVYIDGIPLDLASSLLPGKTKMGLSGLALHIHMHARAQQEYADKAISQAAAVKISKAALLNLLNSLEKTIQPLKWEPKGTEWVITTMSPITPTTRLNQRVCLLVNSLNAGIRRPPGTWEPTTGYSAVNFQSAERSPRQVILTRLRWNRITWRLSRPERAICCRW